MYMRSVLLFLSKFTVINNLLSAHHVNIVQNGEACFERFVSISFKAIYKSQMPRFQRISIMNVWSIGQWKVPLCLSLPLLWARLFPVERYNTPHHHHHHPTAPLKWRVLSFLVKCCDTILTHTRALRRHDRLKWFGSPVFTCVRRSCISPAHFILVVLESKYTRCLNTRRCLIHEWKVLVGVKIDLGPIALFMCLQSKSLNKYVTI